MTQFTNERIIDQYRMGKTLGKGGFSKVRLGTHIHTGQQVALKIVRRNDAQLIQVERELAALQKVQHQHVIRIHHVNMNAIYIHKNGHTRHVILMVLELASGGELFNHIKEAGHFDETRVRYYFKQLMQGVKQLHQYGCAHRDLKPENLLLDSSDTLKIADFGFATMTSPSRMMHTQCGTTGYMAPEMFVKSIGYDALKADIWACGVILFIMTAGFAPYVKSNLTDWWFHKLDTNKSLFWQAHCRSATFSDEIRDLIEQMMCIDPIKRIDVDQVLKHPWMIQKDQDIKETVSPSSQSQSQSQSQQAQPH